MVFSEECLRDIEKRTRSHDLWSLRLTCLKKVKTCSAWCSQPRWSTMGWISLHERRSCSRSGELERHIRSVHEGIKSHQSHSWDYKLHVSLAHLKRHIESLHEGKKSLSLKDHIKSIHEEKNSHKCSICNFSCSTNSTLKRHFESVHEGKGKTL